MLKKLLARSLAVALMLVAPAASHATTYHVRPSGNDNNDGLSYSTAKKTIAHMDAITRPGDKVFMWPGFYDRFPRPDSAGSNPTGGGFITYVGAQHLLFPDPLVDSLARAQIRLPAMAWTNQKYTVVKGVRIVGDMVSDTLSSRDSLVTIDVDGGCFWSGSYGSIVSCVFRGAKSLINGTHPPETKLCLTPEDIAACDLNGTPCPDCDIFDFTLGRYRPSMSNSITDCKFTNLIAHGQPHALMLNMNDSLQFLRNRMHFTVPPDANDVHQWKFFYTRNSLIQDCFAEYDAHADDGRSGYGGLVQRNHSAFNTFNRDSFVTLNGSTSDLEIDLSTAGNYSESVHGTTVDSCFFFLPTGHVEFQSCADTATFTNNQIYAGRGQGALSIISRVAGGANVSGNTIIHANAGKVLDFSPGGQITGDTVRVYNNILYTMSPNEQRQWICGEGVPGDRSTDLAGVSMRFGGYSTLYKANWNLYRIVTWKDSPTDTSNCSDRAILLGSPTCSSYYPGDDTGWEDNFPAIRTGDADSLSIRAGPKPIFVNVGDGANWWTMDLTPVPGSRAIGNGIDGTDIGAIQSTAAGQLHFEPTQMFWGSIAQGAVDTAYVTILNTGSDSLRVDLAVTSGDTSQVHVDESHVALDVGESQAVPVIVTPNVEAYQTATITLTTDDPQNPAVLLLLYLNLSRSGGGDVDDGFRRPIINP